MAHPISPLTKNDATELFSTFRAKDVINLYQQQLNIDVSRFFKDRSLFYLYKCTETGYKFYYPKELSGDGKFYEVLQTQLGPKYYHEWKFENQLAFDEIRNNDTVLDIGCGIGNFLTKAVQKTNHVFGLELNEKAVSVCTSKGLKVYKELIQEHIAGHEELYDVVCMFQVLEHIYDVKEFIDSSLKVLKKGGKLIIGVPNNEPYFLGYDKYCTLNLPPHHMGLWNRKVFEKFAKIFNLRILKVEYDTTGKILIQAYLRAKYLAGIKSPPGKHSLPEKIKMASLAFITLPVTLARKLSTGLRGSHMAVVFQKL
jgi:2-polyprenyl-3-methyl-5-hydroxy-6-metoxy-1,4-benzoquinol methylase